METGNSSITIPLLPKQPTTSDSKPKASDSNESDDLNLNLISDDDRLLSITPSLTLQNITYPTLFFQWLKNSGTRMFLGIMHFLTAYCLANYGDNKDGLVIGAIVSVTYMLTVIAPLGILYATGLMINDYYKNSNSNNEKFAKININIKASLLLAIALTITSTLLILVTTYFIIPKLNYSAAMCHNIQQYLLLLLSSAPATILIMPFQQLFYATGKTIYPVIWGALGLALFALLSFGLTFGFGAFPELGYQGVAIALSLRMWFVALLTVIFFYTNRHAFKIDLRNNWHKASILPEIVNTLNRGFYLTIHRLTETGVYSIAVLCAGITGKENLSIQHIANQFISILMISIYGMFFTAKFNTKDSKASFPKLIKLALFDAIIFLIGFTIFAKPLAHLFTHNQNIIDHMQTIMPLIGVMGIFEHLAMTCIGTQFNDADDKWPVVITTVSKWLSLLIFGNVVMFGFDLPAYGMQCGLLMGSAINCFLLASRLHYHYSHPDETLRKKSQIAASCQHLLSTIMTNSKACLFPKTPTAAVITELQRQSPTEPEELSIAKTFKK